MPSQPPLNKGTLTLLAPKANDVSPSSKNTVFVFQYNPDKLIHTFSPFPSFAEAQSSATTATSTQANLPTELFNVTFELDITDLDSAAQNQKPSQFGLHPALAVLELMMQPQTVGNQTSLPIVIFNWGTKRVVAVRIESLNVEERSFDILLNPTQVCVSLTLRVLGLADLKNHPGARGVSAEHQNVRAALVDDYKRQTGQVPYQTLDDKSGLASVAAGSGAQRKKRISA